MVGVRRGPRADLGDAATTGRFAEQRVKELRQLRFGASETKCQSCQQLYPASDLDRYLWCPNCRLAVRRRGAVWGRLVGVISSLGVGSYLYVRVQPSTRFLAIYVLILGLTYVLTSRIAVAVIQGYYRARGSVAETPPPESE